MIFLLLGACVVSEPIVDERLGDRDLYMQAAQSSVVSKAVELCSQIQQEDLQGECFLFTAKMVVKQRRDGMSVCDKAPSLAWKQVCWFDLVDAAVASGDLVTARSYLSIEGGHGTVSSGWVLDCAIAPWKEGEKIWKQEDLEVVGETIDTCHILWKGEEWELYDCSFGDVDELCDFLMIKAAKHNKRQKIK